LTGLVTLKEFRRAVREGRILKAGPNRYVLPGGKERIEAAARVAGSLSHVSAAQHHGWKVKHEPPKIQVVVPRGRRLSAQRREGLEVFHGPVDGLATDKVRTVIDCLRLLPFDEALGIADSALRDPAVTMDALLKAAHASPRTGRSKVLLVLSHADSGADNTFESSLRALCIEAGFLCVDPGADRRHRHLRHRRPEVLESPDYVLAVLRDVLQHRPRVTRDAG